MDNEVLNNIHENFMTIAFRGAFKIHSLQEARGIAGMKGLDEKVCILYYYILYSAKQVTGR